MTAIVQKQSLGPVYYVGFKEGPDQLYLVVNITPAAAVGEVIDGGRHRAITGDQAFVFELDHESGNLRLVARFAIDTTISLLTEVSRDLQ